MRVALIDDDIEVLEMLRNLIDWDAYGYDAVETYEDGEAALQGIDPKKLELLITDIGMPGIDGFQLTKELKKENEKLKVIFLTCFEEFSFAKEAVSLSAEEYLLKYALTKEQLISVLDKIGREFQNEKEQRDTLMKYSEEVKLNRDVFKQKLLFSLVYRGWNEAVSEYGDKLALYDVRLPGDRFQLGAIFLDPLQCSENIVDDIDEGKRWQAVKQISKLLEDERCTLYPIDDYMIFFYEKHDWTGRLPQSFMHSITDMQQVIAEEYHMKASVCIGSDVENKNMLRACVDKLHDMREQYFYEGIGTIITEARPFYQVTFHHLYKKYFDSFKVILQNADVFPMEFNDLCEDIRNKRYSPQAVKQLSDEFGRYITGLIREREENFVGDEESYFVFDMYIKEILSLYEFYRHEREGLKQETENSDINEILSYVDNHLDQPINLQSVADRIHKNSSYLSRLFKQMTGMNFTKYLNKKKVDRATYLLKETSLPVGEIAEQIGIDNIYYFYRFYKKESGQTPGNIRHGLKEETSFLDSFH